MQRRAKILQRNTGVHFISNIHVDAKKYFARDTRLVPRILARRFTY